MENAVKALLMAAGVLIGVMILSLGASLYSSLSGYVEQTQQDIEDKKVQQFNEQFLKYINSTDNSIDDFVLTIHDVITTANLAYENNLEYGLTEYVGHNYYITVNLDGRPIELDINEKASSLLKDGLDIEYICGQNDVEIDPITKRVYEVNFWTKTQSE